MGVCTKLDLKFEIIEIQNYNYTLIYYVWGIIII